MRWTSTLSSMTGFTYKITIITEQVWEKRNDFPQNPRNMIHTYDCTFNFIFTENDFLRQWQKLDKPMGTLLAPQPIPEAGTLRLSATKTT